MCCHGGVEKQRGKKKIVPSQYIWFRLELDPGAFRIRVKRIRYVARPQHFVDVLVMQIIAAATDIFRLRTLVWL
jgi:hypothetical protein